MHERVYRRKKERKKKERKKIGETYERNSSLLNAYANFLLITLK